MIHYEIIEAINKARPEEKPLDFLGFFPRPMGEWRVFSLYRSCCPGGKWLARFWLATAGGTLCFAFTAFFAWRALA